MSLAADITLIKFEDFVSSRAKKMPRWIDDMLHAGVGIAGEAGEVIDAIKKEWIYGKPVDKNNIKEELGDLLFYIQMLATQLGVTIPELMDMNMEKLKKRYPEGYSDKAAQERADKKENND